MIARVAVMAAVMVAVAAPVGCGGGDKPSTAATPAKTDRTDATGPTEPHKPLTHEERILAQKVRTYLAAVAAPRPKAVCAQLADPVKKLVIQALKRSAHLGGNNCAEITANALRHVPPSVKHGYRSLDILGVRIFGKRAGVTYEAPGIPRATIGLIRVGDTWKLSALGGTPAKSG